MNQRGGVYIGDVVGLGKTLMATALARILQDDYFTETLIICPKNLVKMWQDYVDRYRLIARVMSLGTVINELPQLRRYRMVLVDESHNLRNREGKRYRIIREYIDAKRTVRCILLSATPYNKTYLDLATNSACSSTRNISSRAPAGTNNCAATATAGRDFTRPPPVPVSGTRSPRSRKANTPTIGAS